MGGEFRVLEPCTRDSDSLDGQGVVRYCPDCRKNVYDFAHLRRDEIARLAAAGKMCAIIDREPDGVIRTADGPTLPRLVRRQFLRWASLLAALPLRFASAQRLDTGTGGIGGVVGDATGPYLNANLSLGKGRTVSSSALGKFEFMNLTPGVYSLTVDAQGFERRQLDVTITAGKVIDVGSVSLQVGAVMGVMVSVPAPAGSLAGVVVDSTRAYLPGAR